MRVGAMVVGILFAIWTFFEAILVTGLSSAGNDDETATAGAGGVIAAILCGLAAALVLALPLFSAITFGLAGLVSYVAAGAGYSNHWFYGTIFFGLGIMAFFGWLGKRRDRREVTAERRRQADRDERLEALLQHQRDTNADTTGTLCTSCGARNSGGVKFCSECGSAMPVPV